MNVTAQKFQSSYALVGKPLARSNHRTTLPQLRCAQQLPQRGNREGFCHSTGCSLKSGVAGDFHRPYETQKILHFTIHRGTLPQSRPLGVTAPSEREPGGLLPSNRVLAKIVGWRAIFIAPTKLREFYISPSNRVLAKPQAQGIFIFFSGVFYDSNLFSLPWGYASVLL